MLSVCVRTVIDGWRTSRMPYLWSCRIMLEVSRVPIVGRCRQVVNVGRLFEMYLLN